MASQNLKINITAKDRSKQALSGVQGSLGRLKKSIFSVQSAFIGLGAGLAIRSLINTGKQIEGLQVRLKFLFGSAKEGSKAFDEMAKFASKVPFSLEEIQKGAGVLAVVSKDAKEMANLMEITGNVAAVTGLDFKTTSEQIQRSMSAGISAADLFRDKGVKSMLGFSAGATVTIEETAEALQKTFGKGGKFGGATDALAETLEGSLSMIGDKFFNFKRVLLDAGFFDSLKVEIKSFNNYLEQNAEKIEVMAKALGRSLADGLRKSIEMGKNMIPTLKKIQAVMGSMVDGFMAMPVVIRETGVVGAVIFGKKGFLALAGVSLLIDKILDVIDATKQSFGIFDDRKIKSTSAQIDTIQRKMEAIQTRISEANMGFFTSEILSKKQIKNLEKQYIILEKQRDSTYVTLRHLENQVKWKNSSADANRENYRLLVQQKQVYQEIGVVIDDYVSELEYKVPSALEKFRIKMKEINNDSLQVMKEKFADIRNTIAEGVNNAITDMSQALSRSISRGEDFGDTMKNIARTMNEKIMSFFIEMIARQIWSITLEKLKNFELMKQLGIERMISHEKKVQASASGSSSASGMFSSILGAFGGSLSTSGGSMTKATGGAVSKGTPYMVGENGAEMFVPNQSGQITQSARGGSGGGTNITFNVNVNDASDFEQMLERSRGKITTLINDAVNERGQGNLV